MIYDIVAKTPIIVMLAPFCLYITLNSVVLYFDIS
jgi:hypothetical protein